VIRGTHRTEEKFMLGFGGETYKELEQAGVNGSLMLKLISKKQIGASRLYLSGSE
jgi:hypothetical protein